MGAFICKQPNGKYCRFSTITDTLTHYNMTREEYIEYKIQQAKKEAEYTLDNSLAPFNWVLDSFIPNNDGYEKFVNYLNI